MKIYDFLVATTIISRKSQVWFLRGALAGEKSEKNLKTLGNVCSHKKSEKKLKIFFDLQNSFKMILK